jgi:Holliday junction resolvase RusA-like endonuclease
MKLALRPEDDFPVMAARVVVEGPPVSQGSKTAFVLAHQPRGQKGTPYRGGPCYGGRTAMVDANDKRLETWRYAITTTALYTARKFSYTLIDVACCVVVTFYVERPPSTPAARRYPDHSFDVDKLARAALDGITGPILKNDSRVVDLLAFKRFAVGHAPCMVIAVMTR